MIPGTKCFYTMSERERLPELIDRFNNGTLSKEEHKAFLEMLKASPRLNEEVKLDKELNEILLDTDVLELRKKLIEIKENRKKRKSPDLYVILLAASLLLLVGVETMLFFHNANKNKVSLTNIVSPKKDPIIKALDKSDQLADLKTVNNDKNVLSIKTGTRPDEAFTANPAYENMIGSTRHSGYFKMIVPIAGQTFNENEKITFQWDLKGDNGIKLIIIDNQGKTAIESGLLFKNRYTLPTSTLKYGLYYYKVIEDDELMGFGKFKVKGS